jgi:3-phenylpropionate/cinnamic acid dioxygenase small subunit
VSEASGFDRAVAMEDIRRVVFTYPEASDTGDVAGVGRLLDGARMGHFGVPEADLPIVAGDAFAELYERSVIYYPDGLSHAKHLITNIDIEISPDGREARSHSNFVVLQARPELPLQVICTGRYDDTLRRSNGEWKMAVRRECMDIKGDVSFHVRQPEQLEVNPALPFDEYHPDGADAPPAAGPEIPDFDRALATEDIRRIVLSYPQRVDSGDFAAVGELLAGVKFGGAVGRNAPTVTDDQMQTRTAKEIEDLYQASVIRYDDGKPHTKHLITNIDVTFSDDGRSAQAHSYYTVLQGLDGFPLQIIISGRYDDEFRLTDGEWRLVSRREYTDLVGDLSRHVSPETLRQLSAEH